MEKKKTILLSAAVVMVAVGGFWMLGSSEAKSTVSFATENVKKAISAIQALLQEPSNL